MMTAAFDAPYTSCPGDTANPSTLAKFTIADPSGRYGRVAAVTLMTPRTFTSNTSWNSSAVVVSSVEGG
jgi:hypothetical protein